MTILDFIDTKLLINEMFSKIDEYDWETLSQYICKCNDSRISISNETIIKSARELFGEEFYLNSIQSIARLN